MRFIKMKNVKKEYGLNALAELPPAPDGEMLAAFAKAMRVVAAEKTFNEMSVLDIVEASGFTSRTFYNHFRSKYDLLFWSYVSEDYRALQMSGGDCPMRTCRDWIYNSVRRIYNDRRLLKGVFIERSWEERRRRSRIAPPKKRSRPRSPRTSVKPRSRTHTEHN